MQRTKSLREAVTGTGRSQRAARRRHTDQRVVRRLDPLEVRHVAATTRVAGEATEADRLDSRALLEAEHEVRVVQYAVRTSASFRESASSSSWTRHSLWQPAGPAGAVLVKSETGRGG